MRNVHLTMIAVALVTLLSGRAGTPCLAAWTATGSLGLLGDIDLVVDRIDPDTLHPGDPALVTVRIRNQGTMPASGSTLGLRIDGATTWWTLGTPPITPGGSADVACNIGSLGAGSHTVEACADLLSMLPESDESNNCATEPLWMAETGTASVPVETGRTSAIELSAPPNPAHSGRPLDLRFSIPSAGAVRLDLFDAGGRQVDRIAIDRLSAGEHHVQWTPAGDTRLPSGIYYLRLSGPTGSAVRKVVILD